MLVASLLQCNACHYFFEKMKKKKHKESIPCVSFFISCCCVFFLQFQVDVEELMPGETLLVENIEERVGVEFLHIMHSWLAPQSL